MFCMLAAILHLTQIEFQETDETSGELNIIDTEPMEQGKGKWMNIDWKDLDSFILNSWFWLPEEHLIKINITRWIMKPRNHALTRDGTWQREILLNDGWCSKKYRLRRIYARTVHHRFLLASYERLNYGVRNTNTNIHLTWIVLM